MALTCAFCGDTTDDNKQSINFLQSFYSEFNITTRATSPLRGGAFVNVCVDTTTPPANWSVCVNCFSAVQLLLKSKRKVNKVEFQVRELQKKLLKELKVLSMEVDIMSGNMVIVDGILKRNTDDFFPSPIWRGSEDGKGKRRSKEEMEEEQRSSAIFREKVAYAFRDFESFKNEINSKLLPGHSIPVDKPANKKSENEPIQDADNISNNFDFDMNDEDDVSLDGGYHDDKVKQENLDDDQDQDDLSEPEDHQSPVSSDDDEEFHPNNQTKSVSSLWNSKKKSSSKSKSSFPFTCDICLKPLKTGIALRSHIWTHLSSSEKEDPANQHLIPQNLVCKFCRKEFRLESRLKRHQAIHKNPEDRVRVICQDCGVLVFPGSFPTHKKSYCVDSKSFSRRGVKCPICEVIQKNTRILVKHLVKAHPNDKHYPCDICGVRFRTKAQVYQHKKTHAEVGSYLCQGCGRNFKCQSNLKRHEKNSCPGAKKKHCKRN